MLGYLLDLARFLAVLVVLVALSCLAASDTQDVLTYVGEWWRVAGLWVGVHLVVGFSVLALFGDWLASQKRSKALLFGAAGGAAVGVVWNVLVFHRMSLVRWHWDLPLLLLTTFLLYGALAPLLPVSRSVSFRRVALLSLAGGAMVILVLRYPPRFLYFCCLRHPEVNIEGVLYASARHEVAAELATGQWKLECIPQHVQVCPGWEGRLPSEPKRRMIPGAGIPLTGLEDWLVNTGAVYAERHNRLLQARLRSDGAGQG